MTTFDLSPLYRSTIGFDNLASLLDSVTNNDRNQPAYPPYNIELLEKDKYRITMALAGFTEDEILLTSENNMLTVAAAKTGKEAETKRTFLHQGIAERNFKRQFRIADHVKVTGASLSNGLLHVELEREIPEAMKPRQIAINGVVAQKFLKSA
ncbi:MAG: Hsp20 family protein [Gammaproteobacteria bacterium]|jgi:molecular chaperone IbpA